MKLPYPLESSEPAEHSAAIAPLLRVERAVHRVISIQRKNRCTRSDDGCDAMAARDILRNSFRDKGYEIVATCIDTPREFHRGPPYPSSLAPRNRSIYPESFVIRGATLTPTATPILSMCNIHFSLLDIENNCSNLDTALLRRRVTSRDR